MVSFLSSSQPAREFQPDDRCRFRPLQLPGVRVVIRLTYRCDMTCPYCLVGERLPGRELGLESWQRVLDEIGQIDARKVLLTGGEPLLYPNLVDLTGWISSRGVPVDLNSNLQRMTPTLLADLQKAGLAEISVALDGPAEIHDRVRRRTNSFDRVMTAMSWAFEAGISVDASCVVSPENIPHLDALIDQLQGFPLNSFTVSRLFPIGHGARPGCSLPQQRLTDLHGQLSAKWVGKARFPVRLVGLLGLPRLADCGRGESLVGLTPDGRVTASVLGVETPVVPHPLEVGLLESVRQLRHGLKEKHYRLCCEADS